MHSGNTGFIRRVLTAMLSDSGFFVDRGTDMGSWCDIVTTHGAHPNPQFDPNIFEQTGGYVSLYHSNTRRLASTIAWRAIETADYVADMRDGTAWFPNPKAVSWTDLTLDATPKPKIAGKVHCRGALFSPPRDGNRSKAGSGLRLSWYLTNLMWCLHAEEEADFVVSHAHVDIVDNGLPRRLYGYARTIPMPTHTWPFHGETVPAYMVWSSRREIEEHLGSLASFLRQVKSRDQRSLAGAYETFQIENAKGPSEIVPLDRKEDSAPSRATA